MDLLGRASCTYTWILPSQGRNWMYQGAEFVVSFSSQVVNFFFKVKTSLFEWRHYHISLKWWYFHPIPFFLNKKRCHLMTFSWQLESERMRGKSNHKFRAKDKLWIKWIFEKNLAKFENTILSKFYEDFFKFKISPYPVFILILYG